MVSGKRCIFALRQKRLVFYDGFSIFISLAGAGFGSVLVFDYRHFHPIVIKGEYHYGQKFKWFFVIAGIAMCIGSLLVDNVLLSALMGVGAFSAFWGIKEMGEQQERVRKGWFPRNPKRTYPWDETDKKS